MIDGIHIWRAALDEGGWPGAELLPARERERAAAFLREEPCRRWVAARWALRRVLAEYLDGAAAQIELEVGESGKPRLRRGGGIEFNLSHSGGLALVAVTEGCEIGIDLEIEARGRDLTDLAERVLPAEDAAAVREAPPTERSACFYAAWTRYEAHLKCVGVGLGGDADLRSCPSEGQDRFADLAVENLDPAPGYAAAVAVAAPEVGPIECRSLRAG